MHDQRAAMARRARERAGLFTWERSARLLLECFEELTRAGGKPTIARSA